MDEDIVLNGALKKALESDVVLPDGMLGRIVAAAEEERRLRSWARARRCILSAAASVAFALVLATYFRARGNEGDISDVIRLLAKLDGIELKVDGEKSAEMLLLAWQEAPIADVIR